MCHRCHLRKLLQYIPVILLADLGPCVVDLVSGVFIQDLLRLRHPGHEIIKTFGGYQVVDPGLHKRDRNPDIARIFENEITDLNARIEEMEKLSTEFPQDYEERIERLSEYIASKGARYKNHLATIRSWDRRERREREQRFRQENYETEDTL